MPFGPSTDEAIVEFMSDTRRYKLFKVSTPLFATNTRLMSKA